MKQKITVSRRKSNRMENKPALWRRTAKKEYDGTTEIRNGRKLRNETHSSNQKFPSFLTIELMKRAGISTPVFDSAMRHVYNMSQATNQGTSNETN